MKYPDLRTYVAAIADTGNINIPFFQSNSMQIFLNRRGKPYMSVGGFGAVFKFKDKNDNQYALKVFTRDAAGRAERYQALHDTLQITKFPFMVDFQYVHDGLTVGSNKFPVVVMEWGGGVAFNHAIEEFLGQNSMAKAPVFAGNLYSITKTLQEWNMGHGDFQEGNLLVLKDGRINLIDYDGMFVPALEGEKANEKGMADYQHPKRNAKTFGSTIDDFSLLSILFQLSIVDLPLWKKHNGDKRLILKEADYRDPEKSDIISLGLHSPDEHVVALAKLLSEACKTSPLKIDAVQKIEADASIMKWLRVTEVTDVETQYTSIISKVVSLSTEQVTAFETDEEAVIPVNEELNPEQDRQAADSEGHWNAIAGFFFEDTDDDDEDEDSASKVSLGDAKDMLSKLKSSVMGLIYEEDEDAGPSPSPARPIASAPSKPAKAKAPAAPKKPKKKSSSGKSEEKKSKPKTAAKSSKSKKPAAKSSKEDKPASAPQKKSAPKTSKDAKTAPVPEWMKKRRGK